MTKENKHNINRHLLEKFATGDYSPDELNRILSGFEQPGSDVMFDEYAQELWNGLTPDVLKYTGEENKRYKKEAGKIIASGIRKLPKISVRKIYVITVAASILLAFLAGVLFYLNDAEVLYPNIEISQITKATEKGQTESFLLPDGSSISLNAGSSIEYPETFDYQRKVTIEGEVLFDIQPNIERPFMVTSDNMEITVLGTSFNVKSYSSEEHMMVTVLTGKVSVEYAGNIIHLQPDEQLIIDKITGEFNKHTVSASKYVLWNKGILYFNGTPLGEVISTLERWYDVPVVLEKESKIKITGEHDNKSLKAVLESICFTTGLQYIWKDNYYLLF